MNIRSLRSIAKIVGTVICVAGAIFMALLRGPKLLNAQSLPAKSIFGSEGEHWLLGCLFLFGSASCWSLWLILQVFGSNSSLHLSDISITNIYYYNFWQVPTSASYPDLVSLSSWMCFFGTLQSAAVTLFLEPDLEAWTLHSNIELFCCLLAVCTLISNRKKNSGH